MLVNRVDLMSKMETGILLGHRNHKAIQFKIFVDRRKKCQKNLNSEHEESRFRLLKELVTNVSWENIFPGSGVHLFWTLFKHHLLRV